jgi:hypothetical protein
MEISGYENIEIFNNTQGFDINKCENQIIRQWEPFINTIIGVSYSFLLFMTCMKY